MSQVQRPETSIDDIAVVSKKFQECFQNDWHFTFLYLFLCFFNQIKTFNDKAEKSKIDRFLVLIVPMSIEIRFHSIQSFIVLTELRLTKMTIQHFWYFLAYQYFFQRQTKHKNRRKSQEAKRQKFIGAIKCFRKIFVNRHFSFFLPSINNNIVVFFWQRYDFDVESKHRRRSDWWLFFHHPFPFFKELETEEKNRLFWKISHPWVMTTN